MKKKINSYIFSVSNGEIYSWFGNSEYGRGFFRKRILNSSPLVRLRSLDVDAYEFSKLNLHVCVSLFYGLLRFSSRQW